MKNFETFKTEEALLRRINELRAEGYSDSELEGVSKYEVVGDCVNCMDYNEFIHKDGEISLGDRILSFFTGEDLELKALERYNLDEASRLFVDDAIKNGDYVLFIKNKEANENGEAEIVPEVEGDPIVIEDPVDEIIEEDYEIVETVDGTDDQYDEIDPVYVETVLEKDPLNEGTIVRDDDAFDTVDSDLLTEEDMTIDEGIVVGDRVLTKDDLEYHRHLENIEKDRLYKEEICKFENCDENVIK